MDKPEKDIVDRLRDAGSCVFFEATAMDLQWEAAKEIESLRNELKAADGRVADYRTVAIYQGWSWAMCDAYGREEYFKLRGEHVDACALNAGEKRARIAGLAKP